MSIPTESVRVVILGDEYTVKSDTNAEITKKVADYVGQKMSETPHNGSSRDKLKSAILSSMNIAGELFEYQDRCRENDEALQKLHDRVAGIINRIDTVLNSH